MIKKIESMEQLKELSSIITNDSEYFIQLQGGLRSCKRIEFDGITGIFYIENCMSDTEQELTEQELFDESITNIGRALKAGHLFYESGD